MTYFCFIESSILSVPHMEPLAADDPRAAVVEAAALLAQHASGYAAHVFADDEKIVTLRPDQTPGRLPPGPPARSDAAIPGRSAREFGVKTFLRDNGLTLTLLALFGASVVGQALAGLASENAELADHGRGALSLAGYLASGAFLSSLFENWESEFLQMWAFVMLTAYLFQRGSPESKDPDAPAPQDRDPALDARNARAPLPVRLGGLARAVYSHSLGLTLFLLFAVSFSLHLVNSARLAADEAQLHGEPVSRGLLAQIGEAQFWFESFQNWQSEFLSTAVLIVLAIFLRERGSPESKPVGAPHQDTGTD